MFKIDSFLLALLAAVGLALIWPEPGRSGGFLHWELVTTYGVCGVFFLYGLTLAPAKLKQGAGQWKAHVAVVVTTFAVFPVVVLGVAAVLPGVVPSPVLLGFVYLAALPSTVSSSVAMVSLARGDVPVAVFNATLSSLLGVVLTPIIMGWYMQAAGADVSIFPILGKVVLLVLVPIVLGQIARLRFSALAARHAHRVKFVDRAIIIAIVYGSFSTSTANGLWSSADPVVLALIAAGAAVLFFVVFALAGAMSRLFGLSSAVEIAVKFCGSNKSLATGVPLAAVIFAGAPETGMIILPLMAFHFIQLVAMSALASNYSGKTSSA